MNFYHRWSNVTVDIPKYMDINEMLLLLLSLSYGSEGHSDLVNCDLEETPSLLLPYSNSLLYQILKHQVYSNSKQIFISLIGLVVFFFFYLLTGRRM